MQGADATAQSLINGNMAIGDVGRCSSSAALESVQGGIDLRGSPTPSAIPVSTIRSDSSQSEEHVVSAMSVFGDTLALDARLDLSTVVDAHEHGQEAACDQKSVSSAPCDDMDGSRDSSAQGDHDTSLGVEHMLPATQGEDIGEYLVPTQVWLTQAVIEMFFSVSIDEPCLWVKATGRHAVRLQCIGLPLRQR